jgi:hypothetical protein
VPDPMNPQAFNRYGYCLNNPLKYTDPSGHDVYINDINVELFYDYYVWLIYGSDQWYLNTISSLEYQAWNTLSSIAPDIIQMLVDSDLVFNIQWGDAGGDLACTDPTAIGADITLDSSILRPEEWGTDVITWALSHEAVHCIGRTIGIMPGTFWEEAIAMQFQYQVGQALGFDPNVHTLVPNLDPVRRFNYIVHKALGVNLSDERTPTQDRQLYTVFRNTTYWDAYVEPNGLRRYYPPPSYMEKLLSIF